MAKTARHADHNKDRKVDGKVEANVTWTLGGKKGPQFEAGVKGEIKDKKGNSASAGVQHDSSSGETKLNFSGSKEFDYKDRKHG